MKTITNTYKKISTWIFRDSLELNKYWWHRLIKVFFLSLFFIISIASYVTLVSYPDAEFLSKHNISVKNTLYQFTENYEGEDYDNTIPKFFEQKGHFGLLIDGKIEYMSSYLFGNSMCIKTPEKYLDGIAKVAYPYFTKDLSYEQLKMISLEGFTNDVIKKQFYEDTTRKCFFYDLNKYNSSFKKIIHLSDNVINYRPNAIFYIEATIIVPLIALVSFIFFALIYYRLILYIVYGDKK